MVRGVAAAHPETAHGSSNRLDAEGWRNNNTRTWHRMKISQAFSLTCCIALAAGCKRPELASKPLNERQLEWAQTINKSYSAWQPPYLSPAVETEASPKAEKENEYDYPLQMLAPISRAPEDEQVWDVPDDDIELIPVEPEESTVAAPGTYTVKQGDTLMGIANRLYGRASAWKRIWKQNRDMLSSPDKLRPGMVLQIPEGPVAE